jgi:hypothetical protein
VYTFELSKPRIGKSGALVFRAKRIGPPSGGPLEALGKRADRPAAHRFSGASLFVDAGGATQVPVTVNVSGLAAGQSVSLNFNDSLGLDATSSWHPQFQTDGNANVVFGSTDMLVISLGGTLNGSMGISVAGGDVAGSARIPVGATVTMSVNGGPPVQISNGAFAVPS